MIGSVKVMVIWTSSPLAGPSPPVLLGVGLMPFTTVFDTKKLALSEVGKKLSVPSLASRVAASISTSAGELTRESTRPDGGLPESSGNLLYSSTSTLVMFANGALISPVIVAPLMTVVSVRMKSSAVSVSTFPGLSPRESAPSRPSAPPALKKKGSAAAGVASTPAVIIADTKLTRDFMSLLLIDDLVLNRGRTVAQIGWGFAAIHARSVRRPMCLSSCFHFRIVVKPESQRSLMGECGSQTSPVGCFCFVRFEQLHCPLSIVAGTQRAIDQEELSQC